MKITEPEIQSEKALQIDRFLDLAKTLSCKLPKIYFKMILTSNSVGMSATEISQKTGTCRNYVNAILSQMLKGNALIKSPRQADHTVIYAVPDHLKEYVQLLP